MIAEHFEALQSRIEAGPDLDGRVFDTIRTVAGGGLAREQYVVLYRSTPTFSAPPFAVARVDSTLTFAIDVRVVGTSPTRVVQMLDAVLAQLVGHSLIVSGRVCSPIEVPDVGDVRPDTSVSPYLYFCDLTFDLVSEPA